jgi:small subunit ribosomal protein S1
VNQKEVLKYIGMSHEELEKRTDAAMGSVSTADLHKHYEESVKDFEVDTILKGRILNIVNDDVIVDVGYKSEGIVSIQEFWNPSSVKAGDEIEVFLEGVEDEAGLIAISKAKADRIRGWERIITSNKEGDVVRGRVIRKIKGGLLVDIGVPVFLPASQVDIRRVEDIGDYVGREVECKIIKIDEKRMNIIVSRRKLLEEQREEMKKKLMEEIQEGDVRRGIVKNIADFGVFVDLGGIDGLLHITDMSWGRISHPSEMVKLEQPIEVKILKIDREHERIALGYKQLSENPWAHVEEKYQVGTRVKGKVVNILPYGAFVELETGVEGLVHISEMSWTKRVNHPSEMVAIGDQVEVVVLNINREKEEISLGMKQTETNPWDLVESKYSVGTKVKGKVRNLTNYGAFVELEEGIDGLLHVSDMSWTKKVLHPSELLKKGDAIETVVLSVDPAKKRVALGLKQLQNNPWDTTIPEKYCVGTVVQGKITKLTHFGAFVELEPSLEGLLHVSKLAGDKAANPAEMLSTGDVVEVEVIRLEPAEGKIGLSLKRVIEHKEHKEGEAPAEVAPA